MYDIESASPPPESSGGGEAPTGRRVWVSEKRRVFKKTGKVVIQPAHWHRLPSTIPEDAWIKGAPLRSVGHLIAALRADVWERLGSDIPSQEMLDAWWSAVEETEWREMLENVKWNEIFFHSLDRYLSPRKQPPMVRRIERERAKHSVDEPAPSSPPSAFKRYHLMRPDVYVMFKQAAEDKLTQGCVKYSARRLFREMRAAGVSQSGVDFAADYARKLMAEDERFVGFFRLLPRRKQSI